MKSDWSSSDFEQESFYKDSNVSSALNDYLFNTIVGMKSELEKMWKDDETMKDFFIVTD